MNRVVVRMAKAWTLCVAISGALAAKETTLRETIDGIFKEWDQPDSPGASVAVIQHDESFPEPVSADTFASRFWFIPEVKFLRDALGAVTSATFGGGRITGVKFQKVQR
jgi:hypothetical protein